MDEEPLQELRVALAGPAVNVVIAAGLFAWLHFSATLAPLEQLTVASGPFLERLMVVNVILVVFNMLSAFPMDGGRVLRALLKAIEGKLVHVTQGSAAAEAQRLANEAERAQAEQRRRNAEILDHRPVVDREQMLRLASKLIPKESVA